MKRGMVLALVVLMGACSMGMKGPPERPWTERPQCDDDDVPWAADVYGGYTLGSLGVPVFFGGLIAGAADADAGVSVGLTVTGAVMIATGALLAWQGLKGKRIADRCRDARAQWSLENQAPKPTATGP